MKHYKAISLVIFLCLFFLLGCSRENKMWEENYSNSLLVQGVGLVKDRLYLRDDNYLYALDPLTGHELLKIEAKDYYPITLAEKLIIVNSFNSVVAYDESDGKKLWEVANNTVFSPIHPYIQKNLILIEGLKKIPYIYEIDSGSGLIVSESDYLSQEKYTMTKVYYIDDRIIIYSQKMKDHTLTFFIKNYIEEKILSKIETNSLSINLEVRKKYLILMGKESQYYIKLISTLNGSLLKSYEITTDFEIFPGDEDNFIISENNHISIYDIKNHTSPKWEYQLKANMSIRSVYTKKAGQLFILLTDNKNSIIYQFDINTGEKIKKYNMREVINELITNETGTLYLITNTKKVVALDS